MKQSLKTAAIAAVCLFWSALAALAQISTPGLPLIPLGYCQMTLTGSAASLATCVRATFTASAGSNSFQLVVSAVASGVIKPGDLIVTGTGLTAGTVIVSEVFVPGIAPGGVGTYNLSATNTASSATVTSGGIPTGANQAYLEVDTAAARYRDDGASPTTAIGQPIASGGTSYYAGTLSALRFIAQTASPVLNVSFYKSP